jgi:GTP pyrophosphokinase
MAQLAYPLSAYFEDALQFACEVHRNQSRKGTEIPYISHPLAVASIALEYGATETQAIAALLHDVVEDSGDNQMLPKVAARFGEDVAGIVDACSHVSVADEKKEWRARREVHLAHLQKARADALLVTAADKLHNLNSILRDYRQHGNALWARFNAGPDDQVWYYESMIILLESRLQSGIVDALKSALADLCHELGSH